ncbi:hypothetical protein Tco_1064914 [Tanacetum coccineum]
MEFSLGPASWKMCFSGLLPCRVIFVIATGSIIMVTTGSVKVTPGSIIMVTTGSVKVTPDSIIMVTTVSVKVSCSVIVSMNDSLDGRIADIKNEKGASDEELEELIKDQLLPADASPVALLPGYIFDSDPKEDDEED